MPQARSASAAPRPTRNGAAQPRTTPRPTRTGAAPNRSAPRPTRNGAAQPQRRREPARPRKVVRGPVVRVRWDRVGRVGLLVVLAVVAALYVQHTLSYFSTRAEANRQASVVERLTRENASLTKQQQSLNDPTTIARDARVLGMVQGAERPYVVTGLPKH